MKPLKNTPLDTVFSHLVRERAENRCEKCNSEYMPQCSHHVSRRFLSIRWSPSNAVCHCASCHLQFTHNPHDHYAWITEYIGKEAFDDLRGKTGVFKLSQPDKRKIHANLKDSWTWMQQQRREGITGRLNFDSPYEDL